MRVLIATFGSPYDEVALRLGVQIARHVGEAPTVLAVIEHRADRPPPPANAILARSAALFKSEGLFAQTRVRLGYPAEQIIREARDGDYDLIIVGDGQERNLLKRLLTSSPVVRIVKRAPCSVLIAKGQVRPMRRILLCDSGAGNPSTGLGLPPATLRPGNTGLSVLGRFTAQLAGLLADEEEVTVLHVMSQMSAGPGVRGKQLRASVEELIEERAPEGELLEQDTQVLNQPGIHPRPEVRHGLVVDEILAEAQRGDYDLVVIGAYRNEGWRRILIDNLAHALMIRLDRPVLIVR